MHPVARPRAKKLTTIEGIGATAGARALQGAWQQSNVPQCGYCQAGHDHGGRRPAASEADPSDADIDAAMSGNICRCGTYPRIRAAIKQAARHGGQAK